MGSCAVQLAQGRTKLQIREYAHIRACVKTPEGLTAIFQSEMGVKQGCPLSPTLFGLFLDPLEELLLQGNVDAPFIGDQAVPAQFFADDSQLISFPSRVTTGAWHSAKFLYHPWANSECG
jgi:hypothetical protein